MFEELRQAFREAVENFRRELNRDQVPEAVDRLVRAMRRELAEAKVGLGRLEEEVRSTIEAADEERSEAVTCRRREEMARRIGDEETVKVAGEFAAKHERRAQVLGRKALALREEHRLREAEIREMKETVREAMERRSELLARVSRTRGQRTIQEADSLFEDLERMGERIEELQTRADAAEILSAEEEAARAEEEGSRPPPSPEELEQRLQELKRRMGSS